VNGIIVGLLLALSDRGVEPPPPPKPRSRLARLTGRVTRLGSSPAAMPALPRRRASQARQGGEP